MCEPIYIAGKGNADGPLIKACKQVFTWNKPQQLIVVIWHPEWKDDEEFWDAVAANLTDTKEGTRTLITFFGASIDEMRNGDGGDRLPLLFRLLGRDPDSRSGCCPITAFTRLGKAPIQFDPNDPDTKLILSSNEALELCIHERKRD
jgi:hypothetical protein